MATLFFEGFNQSTIFNSLDQAYWSTQYSQFPKYGFISMLSFDMDGKAQVTRTSPFGNSFLPPSLVNVRSNGGYLFSSTDKSYLALNNPDYNDGTIEPPTFIRCSGFAQPSGNKTYFSLKVYGLESNSVLRSQYPYRNKFLSFCSGNTEILNFNLIKITGNFLPQLNGARETLGIETVYHNNTLGVFDLNIDGISNYNIQDRYVDHRILNINGDDIGDGYGNLLTGKRHIHLELLLDQSVNNSGIFNLKIEGIDVPVINEDINISKNNWSNLMMGSGDIYFDNFRIYNRMTHNNIGGTSTSYGTTYDPDNKWIFLDDIMLIDNTGNLPTSWLGPSSKIISYKPDYTAGSGLFQWTPNTTIGNIIRKTSDALNNNDGDIGYIETIDSGNVSALRFSESTNLSSLPDGIGGIKLYNTARKESLDSQFVNVFATDIAQLNNIIKYDTLILTEFGKDKNDDDTIIDESPYGRLISNSGCVASRDIIKHGDSSFYFPDTNSFIRFDHQELGDYPFTIESWVYLPSTGTVITLLEQKFTTYINALWMTFNFKLYYDGISIIKSGYNTDSNTKLFFTQPLSVNNWHHIALCRNDNLLFCFNSGVSGTSYKLGTSPITTNTIFNLSLLPNPTDNRLTNTAFYNRQGYDLLSTNQTNSIIGMGGYIDNFRITYDQNRYSSNFVPPSSITLPSDYFINLGPVHNVTQSSYKTFQHYSFYNPATNKSWRVSEISGMALGVKKL